MHGTVNTLNMTTLLCMYIDYNFGGSDFDSNLIEMME